MLVRAEVRIKRHHNVNELDVTGATHKGLEVAASGRICETAIVIWFGGHNHIFVDRDEEGLHLVVVGHGGGFDRRVWVDLVQLCHDFGNHGGVECLREYLVGIALQIDTVEQTLHVVCTVDGRCNEVVQSIMQDVVCCFVFDEDAFWHYWGDSDLSRGSHSWVLACKGWERVMSYAGRLTSMIYHQD